MISEHLKNMSPNLVEMLPYGAVNEIANEFSLTRSTVSLYLKGNGPNVETTIKLIISAIQKIDSDIEMKKEKVIELKAVIELKLVAQQR